MDIKIYEKMLPKEAIEIRITVFTDEQGFFDEFDDIDKTATHFIAFDGEKAIATCRVFEQDGEECHILGRFAVIGEYRGKGIGRAMLGAVEKYVKALGGVGIILHSQLRAIRFYERCGYQGYGDFEDDEGYPHLWMKKML